MAAGNSYKIVTLLDERDALRAERRTLKRKVIRAEKSNQHDQADKLRKQLAPIEVRLAANEQELDKLGMMKYL